MKKTKEQFEQEVEWAVRHFQKRPEVPPNTNAYSYDVLAKDDYPPISAAEIASFFGQFDRAVEQSKGDRDVFIGIQHQIAEMLEAGEPLPQEYQEWLIQFLRGRSKPDKKAGRPSRAMDVSDEIYRAIEELRQRGWSVYQNQATKTIIGGDKYYTAPSIVAEALRRLNRHPQTYDAVLKHYKEGKQINLEMAVNS